uniref:Uncharacterized protein n=1 Tax=Xenorhabdus hominickii TaxID=351679 RepID=A0A1V0M4R3_XENHO|nr:hypothetical protein [Xenorhabdus hominickii]
MVNTALALPEQERIINAIEKASDAELSALAAIRTDIRTLFSKNDKTKADGNGLIISRPPRRVSKNTQPNTLGVKLIEAEKTPSGDTHSVNDIQNSINNQTNAIQNKNRTQIQNISVLNEQQTTSKSKRAQNSKQTDTIQNENKSKTQNVSVLNEQQTTSKYKRAQNSKQTDAIQNENKSETQNVSVSNEQQTTSKYKRAQNSKQTDAIQNENKSETQNVSVSNEQQTVNELKRIPNVNPINDIRHANDQRIKNNGTGEIPNAISFQSYLANKKALNGNQKAHASIAAKNIRTENRAEQSRTASGRFASKDKNESLKTHKARQQERKDNTKMQAGFLRKLSGVIGQSGKALADTKNQSALDVVGAAGGSFWQAGKEAANVTSNAVNNVVSLHDWVKGQRKKTQPATQQTTIPRPTLPVPTWGGEKQTKSAKAFAIQNQNDQTKAIKAQTQLTQANDEKVISLLEDLVDKSKAKKGEGILGALFSALAVKAIGKKIGGKLGAAILSALALGKIKSRVSKFSAGGTGGNGIEIDVNGHDKKNPQKTKAKNKKGLKNIGKGAVKTTAAVAGSAGVIMAGNAILDSAEEKAGEQATQKAATKGAEKTTESSATKAAKAGTEKSAEKAAGKIAGKTALKAVPLVGTAIGVGWDAYDGFTDTDAQRETFGLQDGQDVTTRQQTEYALANVADLGGLVSGSAGLLADGAKWLGMDSVSEALTFDAGDIAKTIDNGVTAIDKKATAVLDFFSFGDDKDDPKKEDDTQQIRQSQAENAELVQAVTEGADQTTQAVNKLTNQIPPFGTEMGHDGKTVPVNGFSPTTPAQNHFTDGLNIGGKNAQNRNFRNNNFGNLVYVGQKGARLEDANAKGEQRFAKFETPEEGMRALANQITSYANGTSKAAGYQKLNTVESIITKYAPKNENHTEGYIANLAKSLGVNADQQLDLSNPAAMTKMIRAISTIEGGNPQVTDEFIKNAIGTRDESANSWIGKFSPETLEQVNKARAEKGLKAVSSADQFSAPELASTTAKAQKNLTPVAPVPSAAPTTPDDKNSGFWGSLKNARHRADEKFSEVLAGNNVAGIRLNKPDAGLTLPAKMSAENLPAGLRTAMLPADQIVQANHAKFVENRVHDPLAQRQNPPQDPSVSAIKPTDTGNGNHEKDAVPINKDAIPVVSVNEVNKALPARSPPASMADKKPAEGGFSPTWQTVADIVLPSVADTADSLTQGFSSNGMLDGMRGKIGLDNDKIRALSPLTGFVAQHIDGGVHGMTDSVADTLRQPVGIVGRVSAMTTSPDSASRDNPPAMADKNAHQTPPEPPAGGFSQTLQTLADIVLPSVADTANSLTQGFSSNGILDGMLGKIGLDNDKIRALSPLTGFVSQHIDGGVHGMTDSVTETLRQPVNMANLLPTLTESSDPTHNKGSLPVALAKNANQAPAEQPSGGFLHTVSEMAADTVKSLTPDFSSGGLLDDLLGQTGLNKETASALNPLTGFVSGGVHSMTDTLANTVRQPAGITLPSRLPTVTDLAASGVKTPVTRDKSSSNADKAMLTQLQKIAASLEKLIGVQKEANSNGQDPNTTANSAQPAPRNDIPLGAASHALAEMLRDRTN